MRLKLRSFTLVSLLFVSTLSIAEDRINMKGTSIVGNKELPKMLYIVPWKTSEIPEMNEPPIHSMIDEALAPIDRDSFRRQIHYYQVYSQDGSGNNANQ